MRCQYFFIEKPDHSLMARSKITSHDEKDMPFPGRKWLYCVCTKTSRDVSAGMGHGQKMGMTGPKQLMAFMVYYNIGRFHDGI